LDDTSAVNGYSTDMRRLTTGIPSGVPRNFFGGGGGSTNSVDDRGQRERGAGGVSPLVRGSTQFANE
jgi:hypothetical protein